MNNPNRFSRRRFINLLWLCGISFTQANAQSHSKWDDAILVLPFKVQKDLNQDAQAFLGFALGNLFENTLAVRDEFDLAWLDLNLRALFPNQENLDNWLKSDQVLPPTASQRRFIVGGSVRLDASTLIADVAILDQSDGNRFVKDLVVDLPGVSACRSGLLDLLEQAGIPVSREQSAKMLWKEDLSLESFCLLGKGVRDQLVRWLDQWHKSNSGTESFERARRLSPDSYLVLQNLGWAKLDERKFETAIETFLRALEINKAGAGAIRAIGTREFDEEVQRLDGDGRPLDAIPIQEKLLAARKRALGLEHADTARSLDELAWLYEEIGRYLEAETLFQQALEFRQRVLGNENQPVSASLNNLGVLYASMCDYIKAERFLLQALEMKKRVRGAESTDVAATLTSLGALYRDLGEFDKAEPLLQHALVIREKELGPEAERTVFSLTNLAGLYSETRDYAKAEELFQRAANIQMELLGEDHPEYALTLNNLDALYLDRENYEKAQAFFQKALDVIRNRFGLTNPLSATCANNLAITYEEIRDFTKAEPLLQQAIEINQNLFGRDNPQTATSMANLAFLYHKMGKYAAAEPLYGRALDIKTNALGPEHPDVWGTLINLGYLKLDQGKLEEAASYATQSARVQLAMLSKILAFAGEQQRMAYQSNTNFYSLLTATKQNDADLILAVLRYKAVVLDSLIEDREVYEANQSAEGQDLLGILTRDKEQIAQLRLQSPNAVTADMKKKIDALEKEVAAVQAKLGRDVVALRTRRALTVTLHEIISILPADTALVEFFYYGAYFEDQTFRPAYGAVLVLPSQQPVVIRLASTKEVDPQVVRSMVLLERGDSNDNDELVAALKKLFTQIWEPIQAAMPATVQQVIISPDGQLNFVPFAALLNSKEEFLAENLTVRYVTAGRDLLESLDPATSTECVVFADPDFQGASVADDGPSANVLQPGYRGTEKREFAGLRFDSRSLIHTNEEVRNLEQHANDWGWHVAIFVGEKASKASLLRVQRPYVLHLATHGFFEPFSSGEPDGVPQSRPTRFSAGYFNNPMHRSGLALAGANRTLAAWEANKDVPLADDGILTAEDAVALDLKGTWLVALSACRTGQGEENAGEGVVGPASWLSGSRCSEPVNDAVVG